MSSFTDRGRDLVAGRPVRTATAWTALAVGVTLAGALVAELVAPDSDPLLRRLPVVLVLLVLALAVARRTGWRELAAGGPSTWRSTRLLLVPLAIALVPLAWGWSPDPSTLLLLVVGYAATGAFEELWYRGVVLRAALPLGAVRGAVVSSVLFGAAHLSNIAFGASPAVTAAQAVGSAAGGFGYAVLRQRTDALWALAFVHALGDLLLHTTGLHGGALWVVLVGHDVALFAWGLVCLRGLRRGRESRHDNASCSSAQPRASLLPRSAIVAAAMYVAAWLGGLAVAGGSVDRSLDDSGVRAHVVGSSGAVLLQATLVHLVAGLALLVLVVGLSTTVRPAGARRALLASGLGAGALSLAQWATALVLVRGAASHEAAWSGSVLGTVDRLDVVKLVLLCCLVQLAGRYATGVPRWWRVLSSATAALLAVGALGLVVPTPLLAAVLALSLLALLVWAGSLAVVGRRTPDRHDDTAGGPPTAPAVAARRVRVVDAQVVSFHGHRHVAGVPAVARQLR